MALTELQIRQAKPKDKPYMLRDNDGLYLEVVPAGGQYWRLRYWVQGKEKKISLGVYPRVTLKEAREKRDDLKRGLSQGIDPKAKMKPSEAATFEIVAKQWYAKHIAGVRTPGHAKTVLYRLQRFLFPILGSRLIRELTTPELLALLRPIEESGAVETAYRVKQIAGQVFRYGIAIGECEHDLSADLRGALSPKGVRHHGTLTNTKDISGLLNVNGGVKMHVYGG